MLKVGVKISDRRIRVLEGIEMEMINPNKPSPLILEMAQLF